MTTTSPLRRLADLCVERRRSNPDGMLTLDVVESGTGRLVSDPWETLRVPAEAGVADVSPGDVLFGKLRPYLAKVVHVARLGYASTELMCLRPHADIDSRWFFYRMIARPTVEWSVATSEGTKMPRTSWERLGEFRVQVPRWEKQRAVADYLDTETARIDDLIAKKQTLLKALLDRESAHVSQFWEAAADRWGTTRLGRLLVRMEQGWSPQCEDRLAEENEYGVVKAGCVNGGRFRATEHKALPVGSKPRLEYLLRPGDLLVSRASGSLDLIGSAALVPDAVPPNLILCDKVYRLATDTTTDARYVALMLRGHRIRELIKLGVSGGEGMANNLPSGIIRGLPIPVAPLVEQRETVARAQQIEHETSRLVVTLEKSIVALTDRRQALITAAVTGELEIARAAR